MKPPILFAFLGAAALHGSPLTVVRTTADAPWGADSSVKGGNEFMNVNFGGEAALHAKTYGARRKGYLRFGLGESAGKPSRAELRLTCEIIELYARDQEKGLTFEVYGLNDGTEAGEGFLGEDWSETELTYANAPAYAVAEDKVARGFGKINGGQARFLGRFQITNDNATAGDPFVALDSDSSPELLSFIRDDTNGHVTFIIVRNGGASSNVVFIAKESGKRSLAPALHLFYERP